MDKLFLETLPELPATVFGETRTATNESKSRPEGWEKECLKASQGERNNSLTKLAGRYIGKGLSKEEVLFSLRGANLQYNPPLPEGEVLAIVDSIWKTHYSKEQPTPSPGGDERIEFPQGSIQGVARLFADLYSSYLESPWSFWAFCFLSCLGNLLAEKITLDSEIRPPSRLYVQIIGESADDRKSTAIRYTVDLFKETFPNDFVPCYGVGSAEGLAEPLTKNPRTLIVYDETKSFVDKATLKGSVLIQCVNTLFEDNVYQINTKAHHIDIQNAHLSFLGASTLETYERMWGPNFRDIGFLNRLWLVPDTAGKRISIPKSIPEADKEMLRSEVKNSVSRYLTSPIKKRLTVAPEAFTLFDNWYRELKRNLFTKRIDTYGHRLMVLLSANEGKSVVDIDLMERIINLLKWQVYVRQSNDPVDAEGIVARMEQGIKRVLERQNHQTERQLRRSTHAERVGLWAFETALSNLRKAGMVFFEKPRKTWVLASNE